jgi:hypothetical protein
VKMFSSNWLFSGLFKRSIPKHFVGQRSENASGLMQTKQTIKLFQVTYDPNHHAIIHNVAKQLAPTSCDAYTYVNHFTHWTAYHDLFLHFLLRDDLIVYCAHQSETYTKVVISLLWAVALRSLDEVVQCKVLASYPTKRLCGSRTVMIN